MNKLKISDGTSPGFSDHALRVGLPITVNGHVKATVECFGLWSDVDNGWAGDGTAVFFAPSFAVALMQLHWTKAKHPDKGLRVRSFDEWAESEGAVECLCDTAEGKSP